MPRRIAINTLNATTIDILNTIRANASYEYQNLVPEVAQAADIPKVGEVLYGYPALANVFINALVNRIAAVRIKSATFNNAYAMLKKGYLEFGETVEEVFVGLVKAREFSAEKAAAREFKRSLPDVKAAFHCLNYKAQYPITIQDEDLRQAFLSMSGVQDLIARIVNSVYTSAEYDEYLIFKYLLIKQISHGKLYPVAVDPSNPDNYAIAFRGMSNQLEFISNKYNESAVHTNTKRADQAIFMSAQFNAAYDVEVLASAFNMNKADFMGRLFLIDDWTTFDNDRFSSIVEATDSFEPITDEELALMKDVKAVLVDVEWFQIYDNLQKFTETYVSSGLYWNYFLNVWKTVSHSPFSNAVVFVEDNATTQGEIELPSTLTVEIVGKSIGENATVFELLVDDEGETLSGGNYNFVQTEAATRNGIAIHRYGAVMFPAASSSELTLQLTMGDALYTAASTISISQAVGATVTLNKE